MSIWITSGHMRRNRRKVMSALLPGKRTCANGHAFFAPRPLRANVLIISILCAHAPKGHTNGGQWTSGRVRRRVNQLKLCHVLDHGLRHRASSSTRQCNAKCRAVRSDWRYRQCSAMSFDDQPANCQSHPHAIGLCCEERFKDTVDVFFLDAGARIFDSVISRP